MAHARPSYRLARRHARRTSAALHGRAGLRRARAAWCLARRRTARMAVRPVGIAAWRSPGAAKRPPVVRRAGVLRNGGERCVVVPVQAEIAQPANADADLHALHLSQVLAGVFEQGGVMDDLDDIDLVRVPDAMMPAISAFDERVLDVQRQVVEHCGRMGDRFAILDALPSTCGASPPTDGGSLRPALREAIAQWQVLPPRTARSISRGFSCRRRMREAPRPRRCSCRHAVMSRASMRAATRRVGVHKAPANELVEGAPRPRARHHRRRAGRAQRGRRQTACANGPAGAFVCGARAR